MMSYWRFVLLFAYDGGLQPALVLGLALVALLQNVLEHHDKTPTLSKQGP